MNIRTICFVCNGNNSRSVMAEFIARKKWKDAVVVTSCGINAEDNKEIGYHTRTVLEEIGIDIAGKRRNKISEQHMGVDFFYFTSDSEVMEVLVHEYKIPAERIRILEPSLMDPKDCGFEVYRNCRDKIVKAINAIDLKEVLRKD